MRPTVSILINNYNYGRFVGEAIQSALNQTYNPIEIIVVDDGSSDDSRNVIESFGNRIKSIFKKNGGQASAYNAGLKAATGDFVHFLDSDDLLEPTAIEEATRMWEPGVAKIHFYLQVIEGIDGKRTRSQVPASRLAKGDLRDQISKTGSYTSPPASGNLYWRPTLDRIFPMPEPDWITCADTFPIFLTPLFGEVRACEKILGCYRVHGANKDAQTEIGLPLLRYRLEKEAHRDALFSEFCPSAGVAYSPGTVEKDLANMKLRFCSLILEPPGHPRSLDRTFDLARQMILTCWGKSDWRILKKLAFTVWVIYLLIVPKRHTSTPIDLMFAPSKRSRLAQRLA